MILGVHLFNKTKTTTIIKISFPTCPINLHNSKRKLHRVSTLDSQRLNNSNSRTNSQRWGDFSRRVQAVLILSLQPLCKIRVRSKWEASNKTRKRKKRLSFSQTQCLCKETLRIRTSSTCRCSNSSSNSRQTTAPSRRTKCSQIRCRDLEMAISNSQWAASNSMVSSEPCNSQWVAMEANSKTWA